MTISNMKKPFLIQKNVPKSTIFILLHENLLVFPHIPRLLRLPFRYPPSMHPPNIEAQNTRLFAPNDQYKVLQDQCNLPKPLCFIGLISNTKSWKPEPSWIELWLFEVPCLEPRFGGGTNQDPSVSSATIEQECQHPDERVVWMC